MTANLDNVWKGFDLLTIENNQLQFLRQAAIGINDGKIAWLGTEQAFNHADLSVAGEIHTSDGGLAMAGLVDCHTHLVFAGNRADEFAQRLHGWSYQQIAESGGGILSTVRATREADEDSLFNLAKKRILSLMNDGVTTVEIKSGYGLDLATETKMLRVAKRLQQTLPIRIFTTCLAAHALPDEFNGDTDAYIDHVCDCVLPEISAQQLADAIDGFCEGIAFSTAQIERVFKKAEQLGLPVKLHAEQLSRTGGTQLAANHGALSIDHLEYINEADVQAMAKAGCVAVMLPGAFYALKESQLPPIELFRQYKIPMAIGSDLNPGSSPLLSLRQAMNLAATLFGMTVEECLSGVTINAARALSVNADFGRLAIGQSADFVIWDIEHPAELCYWMGGSLLKERVFKGQHTYG